MSPVLRDGSRCLVLAALVTSALASAQVDAGVITLAEPVAPAPPSLLDTILGYVRPYATLKPAFIPAATAVESFGQPNASAITAAANPVLAVRPDSPRLTFQVAQSRFGLSLYEKGIVRGVLEIDFIDFSKASPTVASLPRLRIARIEFAPSDRFSLIAGQDLDLHAPVNAHGSNMVGARFLSGNLGFIRQQVKALGRVGDFELAAAVGMEGANATAKDSAFELSGVPTFAARASWLVAKGRIGVSALGTSLLLGMSSPGERRTFAGGVSAFADVTLGRTTLRAEVSVGQNMANIGLISLGYGGANDVAEWGGFVSARHGFSDLHFVYATAGLMRVINRDAVRPSYAYAAMPADGSAPSSSSAALAGTGPGLMHNAGATLGYELRINRNLGFMLEGFFLQSEHALMDFDAARFDRTRRAIGGELSAVVTF
jgi:hypothetical protein